MSLSSFMRIIMTKFNDIAAVIAQIAQSHPAVDQSLLQQQIAQAIDIQIQPLKAEFDALHSQISQNDAVDQATKDAVAQTQQKLADLADAVNAALNPAAPAPAPAPEAVADSAPETPADSAPDSAPAA